MFDNKQIKYFLIVLFIITICYSFLNSRKKGNEEIQSSDALILDTEHRLIFLPDTGLTYKYYRNSETNDWSLFTDEKKLFSVRYPSGGSFEAKQQDSSFTIQEPGLNLIEYYRVNFDRNFEEKLGGPYSFSFDIKAYDVAGTLTIEEYIKPFLTAREFKFMYPEEIESWPFIVCKPADFENAQAESCKVSYCSMCAEDFYLIYENRLYVIDNFEIREKASPPEWISYERIVGSTHNLQEKLLFETIASTFKALD